LDAQTKDVMWEVEIYVTKMEWSTTGDTGMRREKYSLTAELERTG